MAVAWDKLLFQMNMDTLYTATELAAAGATFTALANRGYVTKTNTTPRKYQITESGVRYRTIASFMKSIDTEYCGLYKNGSTIGMNCKMKGNDIIDAYDNVYSVANIDGYIKYDVHQLPDERVQFNIIRIPFEF